MKVLIIGAGIGGLTTAIALEKCGIDVEIYERATQLQAVGAGLTLWSNAIKVFRALGMGDALLKLGMYEGQGAIRTANGDILTSAKINDQNVETAIASIIVHRAELHQLLLQNMHSQIHMGRELTHYSKTTDGVIVYFADGTTATGDVLIAADGIHSAIRGQMKPQSKPIYSGYTAYRGVVSFDHARVGGIWGESWGQGSRFGIAPLAGNRVYWFATENIAEGQRTASAETAKAHLQSLFADWHHPIPQLLAETGASEILHHDIYDIAPLDTWTDDCVVLLGDAAHAMTPNLGQGACQAIEDAYAIAACLASRNGVADALKRYESIRLPRTRSIMGQSHQIGVAGQLENSVLCRLRNLAVKLVPDRIRDRSLNAVIDYDIVQTVAQISPLIPKLVGE